MSATLERVTLIAPDISCGHCVAAIQSAVGALDGVEDVAASVDTKQVVIGYDPSRVDLAAIEATMAEEGYPVSN